MIEISKLAAIVLAILVITIIEDTGNNNWDNE